MSNLCNKEFEGLMGNTYRCSNDAGHSGCCTAWVNRETGETHGWPAATGSGEPCSHTSKNWGFVANGMICGDCGSLVSTVKKGEHTFRRGGTDDGICMRCGLSDAGKPCTWEPVPTPPASQPTVTLDRLWAHIEGLWQQGINHSATCAFRQDGERCGPCDCMVSRLNEDFKTLALLRAAEQK